jgi:hypothetical protein
MAKLGVLSSISKRIHDMARIKRRLIGIISILKVERKVKLTPRKNFV